LEGVELRGRGEKLEAGCKKGVGARKLLKAETPLLSNPETQNLRQPKPWF
jgi:hypothetical protein